MKRVLEEDDYKLPEGKALRHHLQHTWNRARATTIILPHGQVKTPVFMPVGTQGTIKGLTSEQVDEIGPEIILGNTYHLANRPGTEVLDKFGGLHEFMKWPRNLLTDSGGFQMVSLLKLAVFTEAGVEFENPHNGTKMLLTPEMSIKCQNSIGADIMMALDDVISSTTTDKDRIKLAHERTLRWIDRCISAHANPTKQNLFGIVQGCLDPEMRQLSLDALKERDLPGYAIGGLSGGESKDDFWKMVEICTRPETGLPANKPRYLMGVGYPLDIVVCVALGVDMFDCVYPCRTARFGTALVPSGQIRLTHTAFKDDQRPIDETCSCSTCKNYTRAAMHTLVTKHPTASSLMTIHNLTFMMNLMKELRAAIMDDQLNDYVRKFMVRFFPKGTRPPQWVVDALEPTKIDIKDLFDWENDVEAKSDMPHERLERLS